MALGLETAKQTADQVGEKLRSREEELMISYSGNPLSYYNLIQERRNFVRAGTNFKGGEFNLYDNPTKLYLKIMFYFWNTDSEMGSSYTGLLAPSWLVSTAQGKDSVQKQEANETKNARGDLAVPGKPVIKQSQQSAQERLNEEASGAAATRAVTNKYWQYNSAWGYLMNNNELERAELLKQFITLLSNISSQSPWYFQEVTGLADALKRDLPPSFKDERKKISIKCLPDAVDNRIGTLMDLYKSIVWSWQNKCEVVPANLRKFDMGIYLYSTPIKPMHHFKSRDINSPEEYAGLMSSSGDSYKTSYKYIEFHNCEFDYNSPGLDTLKNSDGFAPEYTINIFFDDCYEQRYNEFMFRYIGDMIEWDVLQSTPDLTGFRSSSYSTGEVENLQKQIDKSKQMLETSVNNLILAEVNPDTPDSRKKYNEMHEKATAKMLGKKASAVERWINNATDEIEGYAKRWVNTKLSSIVLGNTNTYSIPRIAEQLTGLSMGRVIESADAVKSYTEKNSRKTLSFSGVGNGKKVHKKFDYRGEAMGNIYKADTIVNNL